MGKYPINCKIKYYVEHLPSPRHRKLRYREEYEDLKINITSVTSKEAPVAFILSDYGHTSERQTEIRFLRGKLYKKYRKYNGKDWEVDVKPSCLVNIIHPWLTVGYDRTRILCVKKYREEARRYILIDGVIWERCGEPRYMVNTFGLGHNHGGTGLFVEEFYNPNIPNTNYFNALEGRKAVAYANEVAKRRGDTKDVGRFREMIDVIMPQCVKIKPMKEHGKGNKFINELNALAESGNSVLESGLLVMSYALSKQ